MDAMTHAIEAYVSTLHCDYTDPLALHAIKMVHNDLKSFPTTVIWKHVDRMHNARVPLAGMAFFNALLGIVHSMAHKTGAAYTGGHITRRLCQRNVPSESDPVQREGSGSRCSLRWDRRLHRSRRDSNG